MAHHSRGPGPVGKAGRRVFLRRAAAGIAAAGAIGTTRIARAQGVTWRIQSAWPRKDFFHEIALDYVRHVNDMAAGRLKLELLPAGAVVGSFQMLDAVSAGTLDGGHGAAAYWYGRNKAFGLFGSAPPYFGDANQLLGWYYYGGGDALYTELMHGIVKANVVGFLTGPMPTQPLGWFKKEIRSPDDLKDLKYRTVGIAADLFRELGVAVTVLPGGEVVPALERGHIDGAEYNNPSSDRALGFPDAAKIYMIRSYHQRAECFEVIFNRTRHDALSGEIKAILRYAAEAASADMSWKIQDRYPRDFDEMTARQGVKAVRTPDSVLQAELRAWDSLLAELGKDAFFRKVLDSQLAWAKRVNGFFLDYEAPAGTAFSHFFAKRD